VRGGPEYSDMSAVGNKYYLRQAAYMSLRRLGLDHIGLYSRGSRDWRSSHSSCSVSGPGRLVRSSRAHGTVVPANAAAPSVMVCRPNHG
jgi:hypothetical protein